MIAKSIVAVLLSLPASIMLIALFLQATPLIETLRFPSLLMVFPVWVALATLSFLFTKARYAALLLIGISLLGYALIILLKTMNIGGA